MDLNLTESERELASEFEKLLIAECPIPVVRAAEGDGYDSPLWNHLISFGIPRLALPSGEERSSTYLELVLLSELCGRYLVPGPVLETLAAVQALGSTEQELAVSERSLGTENYRAILDGRRFISLAFWPVDRYPSQLVPSGGLAEFVVCVTGENTVVAECGMSQRYEASHAGTPLAKWNFDAGTLTSPLGAPFCSVLTTWRLLTAAALVGLADRAIEIGSEYAKERRAFGTPIGTFQGVAHPLAEAATAVAGTRLLARKAAWSLDEGRFDEAERLAGLAYAFASETAMAATTRCVHIHGGYGSAIDYDIQLFHQRARVLATVSGDPRDGFERAGREIIAAREGVR